MKLELQSYVVIKSERWTRHVTYHVTSKAKHVELGFADTAIMGLQLTGFPSFKGTGTPQCTLQCSSNILLQ